MPSSLPTLKLATPAPTSPCFLCRFCFDEHKRTTHIAEMDSFEAKDFWGNGVYTGCSVFNNLVNVHIDEYEADDILQSISCVLCDGILGSKYVKLPQHFAGRRGPFYLLNMVNILYWDGNNSLPAEAGLSAMLSEEGKGAADPLQEPWHVAQGNGDNSLPAEAGLPTMPIGLN